MPSSESIHIEDVKNQLEEIVKPFQEEQNKRQRKSEFLKKCVACIEKNDFFQLRELLESKQASDIVEDPHLKECDAVFTSLRDFADKQIDLYRAEFKTGLLATAAKMGLPLEVDMPCFSVLKGIEGKIDFNNRTTSINQVTIKSIDPKKILAKTLMIKKKLYDSPFEPQKCIDGLLECYEGILQKLNQSTGTPVSILDLYMDYVLSLQSKAFFQNMAQTKFRGYSTEQFAVDLYRLSQSKVSSAKGGYRIKLSPGRGKTLWLIDQDGEKRLISNLTFIKQ